MCMLSRWRVVELAANWAVLALLNEIPLHLRLIAWFFCRSHLTATARKRDINGPRTNHSTYFPSVSQLDVLLRRYRWSPLSVFTPQLFITSAKEVMFLPDFVCPSVCEQDNSKSYGRIFLKFWGYVGHGTNYQWLNFGGDMKGILDSGSLWNFHYHGVKGGARWPSG